MEKRHYVGYDIDENYIKLAENRIKSYKISKKEKITNFVK